MSLKVLLVCNNAYIKGNGICVAVQSLLTRLKNLGIDAKLMATENPDGDSQPDFPLAHFKFPIFEPLIYANGFRYAKADKKRLREAISWADVVHVLEAFPLEIKTVNIAKELHKPVVATFHLFPENITANLGIAGYKLINNIILNIWRDYVFNKCSHIHCPTETVKNHLLKHKFTSNMRVISNGIEIPSNFNIEAESSIHKPIRVLCIGRLSNEKSQETLLNAMRYCRHAREIQLEFAGKGPKERKYRRMAQKLVDDGILIYRPEFNFYEVSKLKETITRSYLYVHCAWIEVEGLSCIEAISYGTVPIIAKGDMTATSQFALDNRSIFNIQDSKALAEKIDWWIEHPEQHAMMRHEYFHSAAKYNQEKSTREIIEMYLESIKG